MPKNIAWAKHLDPEYSFDVVSLSANSQPRQSNPQASAVDEDSEPGVEEPATTGPKDDYLVHLIHSVTKKCGQFCGRKMAALFLRMRCQKIKNIIFGSERRQPFVARTGDDVEVASRRLLKDVRFQGATRAPPKRTNSLL